jgi:hypothetical protein|eukprot:COSAG02_NODE_716_length_18084_cov_101.241145_4_plen_35_part_00
MQPLHIYGHPVCTGRVYAHEHVHARPIDASDSSG